MNGYHEIDGIPCGANRWLLDDVLRGEWGFDGTVVSDYFAVRQLESYHHVAASGREAAALALTTRHRRRAARHRLLRRRPARCARPTARVTIADVDRAVARVLDVEVPARAVRRTRASTRPAPAPHAHAAAARPRAPDRRRQPRAAAQRRRAAAARTRRRWRVIGPNAATPRNMVGDYAYICHVESLLDMAQQRRQRVRDPDRPRHDDRRLRRPEPRRHGARLADRRACPQATIRYAPGLRRQRRRPVRVRGRGARSPPNPTSPCSSMGDKAGLTPDCTTGETRDVASLSLPGVQEQLVLAVAATGTPVVLVLVAGRPIGSPAVHAAASAVLHAWLPGEAGADAIADALTGAVNPGGKLPVSYPRSSGQIPVFYGHKVSGGRSYLARRVRRHVEPPAVPVRVRAVVHDVRARARCRSATRSSPTGDTISVSVAVRNTGDVARRRGRAALHARPGGVGDASGARAAGVRARDARPWCGRRRSTSTSPSPTSASTTADGRYVVEAGRDRRLRRHVGDRPRRRSGR